MVRAWRDKAKLGSSLAEGGGPRVSVVEGSQTRHSLKKQKLKHSKKILRNKLSADYRIRLDPKFPDSLRMIGGAKNPSSRFARHSPLRGETLTRPIGKSNVLPRRGRGTTRQRGGLPRRSSLQYFKHRCSFRAKAGGFSDTPLAQKTKATPTFFFF